MSTRAIIALVKIIKHKDYGTDKRLEACETLLEYETPLEVVNFAKNFLELIYTSEAPYDWDDPRSISVDHKLWALKLTRKLEAARVRPRTVVAPTPSSGGPYDFSYLAEREAIGRKRQDEIARELDNKVETMDEIRARLKLSPAESP